MIELFIVSIPFIVGCGIRYRTTLLRNFKWKNRHFYNSVNILLTEVAPSKNNNIACLYNTHIRTLMDLNIERLIPNETGINSLVKLAKNTSLENPFIEISDEFERNAFRNLIRDHIISVCSNEWIKRDILKEHSDVVTKEYIFAWIVWPQIFDSGIQRNINKKIRVILIQKDTLEQLITNIGLDNPQNWENHYDGYALHTWKLIYKIAKLYHNCHDIRDDPIISRCILAAPKPINVIATEIPTNNVKDSEKMKSYIYNEPEILKTY